MFSFNSSRLARSTFALLVVFCLSAVLFTGCDPNNGNGINHDFDTRLVGTWTSTYADTYTITATTLYYSDGYGGDDVGGQIRYVTTQGNLGVIIIEYDIDKKPKYYDSYDPETYEPVGDPKELNGNFQGVYYKNLTATSFEMGSAYTADMPEEATLEAAKAAFTLDNEGNYMSMYGTYEKQL